MLYPVLETKRLTLRPFRKIDAPRVQLLAGAEEIAATTLNIPHPYSDGLAEQWISTHEDEFIRKKSLIFAICLTREDKLIGAIGLMLKPEHDLGELGYWIGVPYWIQGYCTEACAALLDYGFREMKLNKIFASYFVENHASEKVMQKLGMKQEAHLHQHIKHRGIYKDLITKAILSGEFRQRNADLFLP